MNFLEQLFQTLQMVPQVPPRGPAPAPVPNAGRLGQFAIMPPSSVPGAPPSAPPAPTPRPAEVPIARASPPASGATLPPRQGAASYRPGQWVDTGDGPQPMFPSDETPGVAAAGVRSSLGAGPGGSIPSAPPAAPTTGPSAGTYLSGALRGAASANNPIGMLFGALGGAMGAGDQVRSKEQLYKTLVANGMQPQQAALFMQSPQAYQMLNKNQGMTTALKEYQFARQQGYQGTFQDYQLDQKKAAATVVNTNVNTKGQTEVDKMMAKRYDEYVFGNKRVDLQNQVGMLGDSIKKLRSTPGITGLVPGAVGILGEDAQNILTPQMKQIRQDIETVAQRSLKEVLGAQFARVEGEMLLERAFNPYLHPEINARRAEQIQQVIQGMLASQDHAANYFESNGFSMQGYRPPQDAVTGNDLIAMRQRWEAEDAQMGVPFGRGRNAPGGEKTAINPQTGERLVLRNGKWEPAQ